jgi:hypothetical protein
VALFEEPVLEFKSRSEIKRLAHSKPDKLAEDHYKLKNQLRAADELIKKLSDLHERSDRKDYNELIVDIRARLANYIDWYHNDDRFDDRH